MSPKRSDGSIRRGPKLKGDEPRKRFNFSLPPSLVEKAKDQASKKGETLSGLVERLLKSETDMI